MCGAFVPAFICIGIYTEPERIVLLIDWRLDSVSFLDSCLAVVFGVTSREI